MEIVLQWQRQSLEATSEADIEDHTNIQKCNYSLSTLLKKKKEAADELSKFVTHINDTWKFSYKTHLRDLFLDLVWFVYFDNQNKTVL